MLRAGRRKESRKARCARNAASMLDEADAAEASEEAALDELGRLKREHAECTRKMERLRSTITHKDAEIEKLQASLRYHTTLQEYQRAQCSPRASEMEEKQDSRKTYGKEELREMKKVDGIHFSVYVTSSKSKIRSNASVAELFKFYFRHGKLLVSKPVHTLETAGFFVNFLRVLGLGRI